MRRLMDARVELLFELGASALLVIGRLLDELRRLGPRPALVFHPRLGCYVLAPVIDGAAVLVRSEVPDERMVLVSLLFDGPPGNILQLFLGSLRPFVWGIEVYYRDLGAASRATTVLDRLGRRTSVPWSLLGWEVEGVGLVKLAGCAISISPRGRLDVPRTADLLRELVLAALNTSPG